MKIIEAMRKIKANLEKIEEAKRLIALYCADQDIQQPTYPDQAGQVTSWLDKIRDLVRETEELKTRISITNSSTKVSITIGDNTICKPITSWITRRDTLAKLELSSWEALTDRGLSTQAMRHNETGEAILVKVRRYYDPKLRDIKSSLLREEPHLIDGALEVANATTELI